MTLISSVRPMTQMGPPNLSSNNVCFVYLAFFIEL